MNFVSASMVRSLEDSLFFGKTSREVIENRRTSKNNHVHKYQTRFYISRKLKKRFL